LAAVGLFFHLPACFTASILARFACMFAAVGELFAHLRMFQHGSKE